MHGSGLEPCYGKKLLYVSVLPALQRLTSILVSCKTAALLISLTPPHEHNYKRKEENKYYKS
jgi:hypothetical protein